MTDHAVDLHLHPNEASGLTPVPARLLPDGWDQAYVTVLDEAAADEAIAVLGHAAGHGLEDGWEARRLHLDAGKHTGKTEDAEACVFHDGALWVAGSHFGSKTGPLQAKRAWLATVAEADVAAAIGGARVPVAIHRNRFAVHRAVNDALAEQDLALRPLGAGARAKLVDATIAKGDRDAKSWAGRVRAEDLPLNVEGMAFLPAPDGRLLLGLRHPVTAQGAPLVVAIEDPLGTPRCAAAWWVQGPGAPDAPVGVRGLHVDEDARLHVLVGNLDAEGKESALLEDEPVAGHAHCEHWIADCPTGDGGPLPAVLHHAFPDLKTVEGVSLTPGGDAVYVVDQDRKIGMRFRSAG